MSGAKKLECLVELKGHEARVWCVDWHPRLPLFVTCGEDVNAIAWGLDLTSKKWVIITKFGNSCHSRTIRSCAFSKDGMSIALSSFDGKISIWSCKAYLTDDEDEMVKFEFVTFLEGHQKEAKGVAWSADGGLIATCGRDKALWIWEVFEDLEFECLAILHEHSQDVKNVVWSPNSEVLVSCSYDNTIKIWEEGETDWYCKDTLSGHKSTVWSIDFDVSGKNIASVGQDGALIIWSESSQFSRYIKSLIIKPFESYDEPECIYSVSWSNINNLIAIGSSRGYIKVYKCTNIQEDSGLEVEEILELTNKHGHSDVNCVKWSPHLNNDCQNLLVSVGDDCHVRLWNFSTFYPHNEQTTAS